MSVLEKEKEEQHVARGESAVLPISRIWSWIKWPLAIALLVVVYYFYRDPFNEFLSKPKNWGYLSAAFCLILFSTALAIVRWQFLVWALEIPFRMRDAFRLGLMGLFLNFTQAGLVGGDLFKAFVIAREHPGRRAEAAATVLLDRILGLIPLMILGTIASLFAPGFPEGFLNAGAKTLLWVGSVGGVVALIVMLQPWFTRSIWVRALGKLPFAGRIFVSILNGITLYQSRPRVLVFAVLMGLVGHIALICGFYCCAKGVGAWAPSLAEHMFFMPLAEVVGLVPSPLPAGIGPLEFAVSQAYEFSAPPGMDPKLANAAGLMTTLSFRMVSLMIAALGGVYYISARKEFQAAMAEAKS